MGVPLPLVQLAGRAAHNLICCARGLLLQEKQGDDCFR